MPEALREDHLGRPHPTRLAPGRPGYDAIVEAHERAQAAGRADYIDPSSGARVMTAATLAARGTCCQLGCRHCPYVGAERPLDP